MFLKFHAKHIIVRQKEEKKWLFDHISRYEDFLSQSIIFVCI